MRKLIALLLLVAAPAWPASPPDGCGPLCGQWSLDAARSDAPEAVLDAALASYKEPQPRRIPRAAPNDAVGAVVEDMERSLGPVLDRPRRTGLRAELLPRVTSPPTLTFEGQGRNLLIRMTGQPDRRLSPGTSRSRVDALGTAKIESGWKSGTLTVTERYDRRHRQTETYALQRDGSLLVTLVLERPGLQSLRIRATYQRE